MLVPKASKSSLMPSTIKVLEEFCKMVLKKTDSVSKEDLPRDFSNSLLLATLLPD
jgi:hypothetical protein